MKKNGRKDSIWNFDPSQHNSIHRIVIHRNTYTAVRK